jgi:hypothetical protein
VGLQRKLLTGVVYSAGLLGCGLILYALMLIYTNWSGARAGTITSLDEIATSTGRALKFIFMGVPAVVVALVLHLTTRRKLRSAA